jgi:hypothetical protein
MSALFEVFYQPGKLFESLPQRRHVWIAPLLLGILLIVAITAITINSIGMREIMRQRLENSSLTAEQMQQALARADSPAQAYASYFAVALGLPISLLVIAGVLTAFGMMTSKSPKFGDMFSMVVLSFVPYWLITTVMSLLILMLTSDKTSLDINNLVGTNVAAYVDRSSVSKGVYSLLSSLDILSFGLIGLLAYGFSKLTNASLFFGIAAIGSLWSFYVLLKMASSLVF